MEINKASCEIAKKSSEKWGTIITGGIVQTGSWKKGLGKEEVHKELREGLEVLIDNDIDLILVEVCGNLDSDLNANSIFLISISIILKKWSGPLS